jgi:hypothetical protein
MPEPRDGEKRKVLSRQQSFQVMKFMSELDTEKLTYVGLIGMIKEQLKIECSKDSIKAMLIDAGKPLPARGAVLRSNKFRHDRTRALAYYVKKLYEELGKEVPEELKILASGMSFANYDNKVDKNAEDQK